MHVQAAQLPIVSIVGHRQALWTKQVLEGLLEKEGSGTGSCMFNLHVTSSFFGWQGSETLLKQAALHVNQWSSHSETFLTCEAVALK